MLKKSWVESANSPETHFPLNNLPYGAFLLDPEDDLDPGAIGVAIGDMILNLSAMEEDGLLASLEEEDGLLIFGDLTDLMHAGRLVWAMLRDEIIDILEEGSLRQAEAEAYLVPQADVQMLMPFTVQEYTDFYAGKHHAVNVGTMFRGADNALPPNWLSMPIGYNGRASTVVISGTDIRRPMGQIKPSGEDLPIFSLSRRLDIELEMGAIVGTGSQMGEPITVGEAEEMIFGYVLLNDWSARDIQAWEYQPLGPFQAKAFATSISPWVVTPAALKPLRCEGPAIERELLPYLQVAEPRSYDIELEVLLQPEAADRPTSISRTNYRHIYYNAAQQLVHHASSGCAMNTGDLLGSGTISGPERSQRGCLLELSWGGKEPLTLDTGEERSFLEDGDTVTLTGYAQGEGYRVGFGECVGTILPALERADREE